MKKFISFLGVGGALLVPFLAVAQENLQSVGFTILNILNIVLVLVLALAFLFFVFGVIKYMTGKEAEDKAKARTQMIYGIIGLFVIFSAWGLVRILQNTIGVGGGGGMGSPCVDEQPVNTGCVCIYPGFVDKGGFCQLLP